MTDQPSNRTITGLGKRADKLGSLRRASRSDQPAPTADEPSTPTAVPERPAVRKAERVQPAASPKGSKRKLTVYLADENDARIRSAFKATRFDERDLGWSAFVEQALLKEAVRREHEYNNGQPFPDDDEPLAPGPTG